MQIITPVKHLEWAAPIIPVVKSDGTIRLCWDYKVMINPVLIPDTYPLPRVEDLFTALSGGKVFSKLNLSHAYLQVPLDNISKNSPLSILQRVFSNMNDYLLGSVSSFTVPKDYGNLIK